jgi:tetratricopeptide (TPR) repeat protein
VSSFGVGSPRLLVGESFASEDSKYRLYCFQHERDLDDATRLVCDLGATNRIGLVGSRGSGRGYFIDAVAYRARCRGTPARVLRIDLEGYEPDDDARFEKFIKFQLERRHQHDTRTRKALLDLVLKLGKAGGGPLAAWLSAVLDLRDPIKALTNILDESRGDLSAPAINERARLRSLLDFEAESARLIIHVPDPSELDINVRNWLLDATQRDRRLVLVQSCTPENFDIIFDRQWTESKRFDLRPLEREELRQALESRFVGSCPSELVEGLWDFSVGVSHKLTRTLRELVGRGVLVEHLVGSWELSETAAGSESLAGAFSQDYYEPLREKLKQLGSDCKDLHEFLLRAALCGRKAPCRLLFESMGLTGDARERLVDIIDDHFVGGLKKSLGLFEDIPTGEPDFVGLPVYRFVSSLAVRAVIEYADRTANEMARIAEQLLEFLKPRIPAHTRGAARLCLSLAEYVEDTTLRDATRQELAWWIRLDEIDAFKECLRRDIEAGILSAEQLWQAAQIEQTGRELFQLALLEVLGDREEGIPVEDVAKFHSWFAMLNLHLGRYSEAHDAAQQALEIAESTLGPNDPNVASCLNNLATLLCAMNRHAEAEPLLRRALAIDEASLGSNHPNVATDFHNLATLLCAMNRHAEAEPLIRRALAIDEANLGPNHPSVAKCLNGLAHLLHATNRQTETEPLIRRALAIEEASLGANHPDVADCLNGLAALLHATKRLPEAEPLLRRALAIDEASLGPNHPAVANCLNNLAKLLCTTKRLPEAEPLFRRALGILESSLSPDHPSTVTVRKNLEMLVAQLATGSQ